MVIRNRLFPYPVLAEDTDDYREGSFIVTPSVIGETLTDFHLKFEIELDNPGIKKYIDSGKAEYVIHIECSQTSYRTMINTASDETHFILKKSDVNGYVNLLGMVVAKERIPFYRNVALDRDYDDTDIFFEKGSILAYYNMPRLNIYKHYEELSTSENLFVLCKHERNSELEHNPISFELRNDQIKIFVDDDIYNSYIKIKDRTEMRPLITSSLLYPALIYMLEELSLEGENAFEDYQEYAWYKQINDYLKKNNKSLYEIVKSPEPYTITAQELLKNPINSLYDNMLIMLGESQ